MNDTLDVPRPLLEVRNPVTGDVASRTPADDLRTALAAADLAAASFPAWSATGPSRRRELLSAAAGRVLARASELQDCMMAETGCSAEWAAFNVRGSVTLLREAAALTTQTGGETMPSDQPGCIAMTFRDPAGVVLGIAPWNAPLLLGLRAIAMALACGNTVVLKASEYSPSSHLRIGDLMQEAGFPDGVVNLVSHAAQDAPRIVEALIAHPAVRRVNFTGPTATGRNIGGLAGKYLKPALLELGGKAPLVVLEDADISQAVEAASFGAFMHQGQICMSTERIVVDEAVADRFAQQLAAKAARLDRGSGALFHSLIHRAAAEKVQALVDDAVHHGASLLAPGRREGSRMSPVVLDRVRPGMKVYDEESFGPIATLVRVRGDAEAVRVANDTEYGLAAAVFGSDLTRTFKVARQIQSGICHINGPTVRSDVTVPFGGVKASGFGRFGGKAAIAEFTELRSLTIQTGQQVYPF